MHGVFRIPLNDEYFLLEFCWYSALIAPKSTEKTHNKRKRRETHILGTGISGMWSERQWYIIENILETSCFSFKCSNILWSSFSNRDNYASDYISQGSSSTWVAYVCGSNIGKYTTTIVTSVNKTYTVIPQLPVCRNNFSRFIPKHRGKLIWLI